MKKQIVKEFVTIKKVRYLPRQPPSPPPPPPPRKVLVVGRCTLDMITVVDSFPIPGEVQRTEQGSWRRGGNAANICSVLRRLGTECGFLGQLSNATAFESLVSSFYAMGIDISNCPRTSQNPPHQSIIVVRNSGTRSCIEHSCGRHELTYQQFLGAIDYQKYDWVHFESRNGHETARMMQAIRNYNKRCDDNIVISIDLPNLNKLSLFMASLADYVFVRKQVKNAQAFMSGHETVWAVRDGVCNIRKRWEAKQPKKTPYLSADEPPPDDQNCLGNTPNLPTIAYDNYIEGACCLLPDETYIKVAGHIPLKVVDTIGEHDTFCGAAIYALRDAKMSIRDALEYATRCTSAKVAQNDFDGLRCMPKDLQSCYYQ